MLSKQHFDLKYDIPSDIEIRRNLRTVFSLNFNVKKTKEKMNKRNEPNVNSYTS